MTLNVPDLRTVSSRLIDIIETILMTELPGPQYNLGPEMAANSSFDPFSIINLSGWTETTVNQSSLESRGYIRTTGLPELSNYMRPIGINFVGQSLGSGNYDIRTEPENPRVMVSPWLTSAIMPDMVIRPLS